MNVIFFFFYFLTFTDPETPNVMMAASALSGANEKIVLGSIVFRIT